MNGVRTPRGEFRIGIPLHTLLGPEGEYALQQLIDQIRHSLMQASPRAADDRTTGERALGHLQDAARYSYQALNYRLAVMTTPAGRTPPTKARGSQPHGLHASSERRRSSNMRQEDSGSNCLTAH